MSKTITVWVSKYALTIGIYEAKAETTDFPDCVNVIKKYSPEWMTKGHWHLTEQEAMEKAQKLKAKRIESLNKSLKAVTKLVIKVNRL